MRTAVCLSGQPREVAETWQSFIHYLLANLPNPDVFIHTSQEYKVPGEYWEIVQPKAYVIEPQHSFPEIENILANSRWSKASQTPELRNSYLQDLWTQRSAWRLKEEHERLNGIKYDLLVRCRPDLIFLQPITLSMLEAGKICTLASPDMAHTPNEFAIGPNEAMSKWFTVFDWLSEYGLEWLNKDHPRLRYPPHGYFNTEKITMLCLCDFYGLRLGKCKFPPGSLSCEHPSRTNDSFYRIAYKRNWYEYDQGLIMAQNINDFIYDPERQ